VKQQWKCFSSGTDPKPVRIFNPATQAFDPEGETIQEWLPELDL